MAYLVRTDNTDRWPAAGGPEPLWGAVIDCALRTYGHQLSIRGGSWRYVWTRVFSYSFSEGGNEAALDIAEEAAIKIDGVAQLLLLAKEHRRAGREDKALRCSRLAD